MMEVMLARKKKMSELSEGFTVYPQVLENVRVSDKAKALGDETVQERIESVRARLGAEGRILVRESGTEPVIRVMVEAESMETCHECVDSVVEALRKVAL